MIQVEIGVYKNAFNCLNRISKSKVIVYDMNKTLLRFKFRYFVESITKMHLLPYSMSRDVQHVTWCLQNKYIIDLQQCKYCFVHSPTLVLFINYCILFDKQSDWLKIWGSILVDGAAFDA